ncbi:MAG TPA: hypothetical protein VGD69_11820 [Herpetosiphonaceae bacterium]
MRLFQVGILSVLLLLMAACGRTPTGSDETGSSPAPATATADSQTQTSPPAMTETATTGDAGAPLVTLRRSGGIAGINETLVVQRDGVLQVIEGEIGGQVTKEGRATPEQIQKLEAALQAEDWQQLDATYGEQFPDAFAYTIVAGSKTVKTYDGAPNPPALANVLSLLDELWQQALQG